jgi:hypothetical protein
VEVDVVESAGPLGSPRVGGSTGARLLALGYGGTAAAGFAYGVSPANDGMTSLGSLL